MERTVREEVGLADLVLAVGVPRDVGNQLLRSFWRDNDDLGLDGDVEELRWVLLLAIDVEQRRGGLPTIDDLQIGDLVMERPSGRYVDARGRCGDAVVVGKEPIWLGHDGLLDALVYVAAGGEVRANVAFEQPAPVASVQVGQESSRERAQVRGGCAATVGNL